MIILRKTLSLKTYRSIVSHLFQKSQISYLIITYYFPLLKICISSDTIFFLRLSKTPPAQPKALKSCKASWISPNHLDISSFQCSDINFPSPWTSLPTLLLQYHKGKIVERHYLSLVSFTDR